MPRNRPDDQPRPIEIVPHYLEKHPASVLYSSGSTRVLCAATLLQRVPEFLTGSGRGWATAEYSMLPSSTNVRVGRERGGHISGRTQEIQRLVGRALRGVLDLECMPGLTLQIDCDVIQADGGTRTASINGACVAASLALEAALARGLIERSPLRQAVGAMSAGLSGGRALLDLDYEEDSSADVDLNLVSTRDGAIVEIQATSEGSLLRREELDRLVDLASAGIREVFRRQDEALEAAGGKRGA